VGLAVKEAAGREKKRESTTRWMRLLGENARVVVRKKKTRDGSRKVGDTMTGVGGRFVRMNAQSGGC
jgi:hypothetical protein